ncbi:MAG TPA: DNA replication and repair protein RecF [Chitinophagaceae bacterium]
MFSFTSISLFQFKNYLQASFSFPGRITGICGLNGKGKTNLLDAIHYLCFTKSYFTKSDTPHVLEGAQGFRIAGKVQQDERERELVCILRETGRKEFIVDGEPYERFSHHIGRFPCVFVAPDDVQIITDGSEERRRFLDTLLSQLDAPYLQHLMDYNKILQQRNSYLKALAEKKTADNSLLDVYDLQLATHGIYVFEQRKAFLQQLLPLVNSFYEKIAGSTEAIGLAYESALLHTGFADLLRQRREKDVLLQRTTQGLHRDDLLMTLRDSPFKSTASQGQRKSLLFALKLAEFELLKEAKGFPPVLLLDDVFEKLDERRMYNLLDWVCAQNQGQVFITDTHRERLETALIEMHQPYDIIEL